jgi:hypothetical protein
MAVTAPEEETAWLSTVTLSPPAPNPMTTMSHIRFYLPAPTTVSMRIYDILGRNVRTIADALPMPAGMQALSIARDGPAPGVFFVRLEAGNSSATTKLHVRGSRP